MKSFVLVLRGINVGGRRKLLMANLKAELYKLGLQNCQSYIQSGNLVFQTSEGVSREALESEITKMILNVFGHEVPVLVIPREAFFEIVDANPFSNGNDVKDLHCTFLKTVPSDVSLSGFNSMDFAPDQFLATNSAVYLHCAKTYRETKMTHTILEKKLGVKCTTRNWKTTLKLADMLSTLS